VQDLLQKSFAWVWLLQQCSYRLAALPIWLSALLQCEHELRLTLFCPYEYLVSVNYRLKTSMPEWLNLGGHVLVEVVG